MPHCAGPAHAAERALNARPRISAGPSIIFTPAAQIQIHRAVQIEEYTSAQPLGPMTQAGRILSLILINVLRAVHLPQRKRLPNPSCLMITLVHETVLLYCKRTVNTPTDLPI